MEADVALGREASELARLAKSKRDRIESAACRCC